jgi:hypothetical protein
VYYTSAPCGGIPAGDRHEIVVLDPRPDFTFIPSLIWLPFGLRDAEDVTFPLAPMYRSKGIRFINEAAVKIDPDAQVVTTNSGDALPYDRLLSEPARGWPSRRSPDSDPWRATRSRSATSTMRCSPATPGSGSFKAPGRS